MSYAAAAKNVMLDALAAVQTYLGLLSKNLTLTGVTGTAATDLLTKASHGLSNGDLVTLAGLTGGAGLLNATPYFVVGVSGNDFQLSHTSGGAAIDFTTNITDVTVKRFVEISGGSPAYARKAVAYAAAAAGVADDTTNGAVFDVPASTVSAVGGYSASTGGTLYDLDDTITEEVFASQGTYTVSDSKLNLNYPLA